jgi:hypothetical protein
VGIGARQKWAIVAGLAVLGLGALAFAANRYATKYVRESVLRELRRRFDADVVFASLNVSALPGISVDGRGFVLQRKDRPGFVVRIERLTAGAGLTSILFPPRHVREVHLDGLSIQLPPSTAKPPAPGPRNPRRTDSPFIVDEILSDRTTLVILPKNPEKDPLQFDIHRLVMHEVGLDRPADFHATLTNAKPPGEIAVEGKFGPWRTDDAGQTPLAASYNFTGADLGSIRGIAGILSSKGRFSGILERLDVDGETDVPDFMVSRSGHRVHLATRYHAIVDGTNGNTLLQPVRAQFLGSSVVAIGGAVKSKGDRGRRVNLDVTVDSGRLEDMIRLATKAAEPALRGPLAFKTKLDLPPGDADIMDRLRLDGTFTTGPARFTDPETRKKLQGLSRRGQGRPGDPEAGSDISRLNGRFRLRGGVLALSRLTFHVEGATVQLDGTYALRTEELDFRGSLRLDAKLSETTTGVKSFFLKLADPLFKKKNAGSVIPIKVSGTREKPSFGLDAGRVFKGNP